MSHKNRKKLTSSDHFWKMRSTMRSTKCACARLQRELHFVCRPHRRQVGYHLKTFKNWRSQTTSGRWGRPWGRQSVRATMLITSSSSSWEVWAIGNAWVHNWKHFWAQNPVFSGKVAVRGRRWRVSVSAVARLDPESGRQNVRETVARARFHIETVKNWQVRTTFWRWGRQNVHKTVARARFHREITKNCRVRTCSDHFLKMRSTMRSTKCARDCSESFTPSVDHIVIK